MYPIYSYFQTTLDNNELILLRVPYLNKKYVAYDPMNIEIYDRRAAMWQRALYARPDWEASTLLKIMTNKNLLSLEEVQAELTKHYL
jgi:hypothetical protein